jgi:putative ABC transport system permease protein
MSNPDRREERDVPEQAPVSWRVAFTVSLAGVKRRLLRSLVTMAGVVLAIAFLCYMLVTGDLTAGLVAADFSELNVLLQNAGVDIQLAGKRDSMLLLLIGLSLLTCLVGITNAMLMAVTERIKEIGTLKCLGALDTFIVQSYFIESSLQGILGTLLGIVLGLVVALGTALANYGGYVFRYFPGGAVLVSVGISFLAGTALSIVASIAPAYWAARKEPVDAMRVEE